MKPKGLQTKIFLDSGDPAETKQIIELLGFLDGQTTNPTLVAKNPYAQERFSKGEKFSKTEIFDFYKQVVGDISALIPDGSVSIEVYADDTTTSEAMLDQGKEMFTWIPNAHVKYPITTAGLAATEKAISEGLRVNLTLCFTQEQAAAVYAATRGAARGDVFISPFIGRLDDIGENGMDLIANCKKMFTTSDGHTEVLAASVRTQDHFMQCLALGADIITAPFSVLKDWADAGKPLPSNDFIYPTGDLKPIAYEEIDFTQPWSTMNIKHELTDKGIKRFASDWNELIA